MYISKGVMEIQKIEGKMGKHVKYQIACNCHMPECSLSVDFDFYREDGDLNLTFWRKVSYYTDHQDTRFEEWLKNIQKKVEERFGRERLWEFLYELQVKVSNTIGLWRRIKDAYKVLFDKEISLEGCMILCGEDRIETLINTLIEGLNYTYPNKTRTMIKTSQWPVPYTSQYPNDIIVNGVLMKVMPQNVIEELRKIQEENKLK